MIALALQAIGAPALIVGGKMPANWAKDAIAPEMQFIPSRGARQSAIALKSAHDRLRKGGIVAIAADGEDGQLGLRAPFLGRSIRVSRGLAALARLTGAPIIPILTTWGEEDWTADLRIFDALTPMEAKEPVAWDRETIRQVVGRFEQIVRATPGQFRMEKLSRYSGEGG